MIVWTRWGILTLLILILCCGVTAEMIDVIMQDSQYYSQHGWPKLLGLWLSAAIIYPLGRTLNRTQERMLLDPETGETVPLLTGGGHELFFVPMEYWAHIFLVLGVVVLFV